MAASYNPVALGVDPVVHRRAVANVMLNRVTLLALSGKLASGKDALGERVMAALGRSSAVRIAFGAAICTEGDQLIAAIAAAADPQAATAAISDELNVTPLEAAHAVELLWQPVRFDVLVSMSTRHPAIRPALQHWGAVRRRRERSYWIRPVVAAVVAHAAAGDSCLLPDVRTPEEAAWARALGFFLVRVDASEETQRRRLAQRDNIAWDAETARSWTETALDAMEIFDLRVDNDEEATEEPPAVGAIVAAIRARAAA